MGSGPSCWANISRGGFSTAGNLQANSAVVGTLAFPQTGNTMICLLPSRPEDVGDLGADAVLGFGVNSAGIRYDGRSPLGIHQFMGRTAHWSNIAASGISTAGNLEANNASFGSLAFDRQGTNMITLLGSRPWQSRLDRMLGVWGQLTGVDVQRTKCPRGASVCWWRLYSMGEHLEDRGGL